MSRSVHDDLLDEWEKSQRTLNPGETVQDRLSFLVACKRLGFSVTWSPTLPDGTRQPTLLPHVPVYRAGSPERDAQESAWDKRCQEMHAAQRR